MFSGKTRDEEKAHAAAKELSDKANRLTAQAHEATGSAKTERDHSRAATLHETAAHAHEVAAMAHGDLDNKGAAAHHAYALDAHMEATASHNDVREQIAEGGKPRPSDLQAAKGFSQEAHESATSAHAAAGGGGEGKGSAEGGVASSGERMSFADKAKAYFATEAGKAHASAHDIKEAHQTGAVQQGPRGGTFVMTAYGKVYLPKGKKA